MKLIVIPFILKLYAQIGTTLFGFPLIFSISIFSILFILSILSSSYSNSIICFLFLLGMTVLCVAKKCFFSMLHDLKLSQAAASYTIAVARKPFSLVSN